MSPRGRRPAGEDARAQIVEAARTELAAKGYDGTSLRGVARAAGVDPALVHHYFAGKTALFAAAMEVPFDPRQVIDGVLEAPVDRLGESLVRAFLGVWDTPEGRVRIAALLRSAATHPDAMTLLEQFLVREIFGRVAGRAGPRGLERRAGLVATQMIGLGFARYVAELPGVADAEAEELVAAVAPVIQRYLDLPGS
ncbi:TetR family transcriptional regulator [Arsenicicoccus cauae]|uniref:TetR family transcriptional regulator n=2 Tax=Arsenicicoccus TaxID=267408 RepID=A0A6I3IGN1_9MICO|nr:MULTISPECIES: TetR family transcriptional regulator [Arsenicicoccus]MCG7320884.1 TetR family transcriptional regulator [Arsenicicoccus bolidensis]MTB73212.1 TetR family transcriptional regulator [Arsenicicoccus cauae]